ncbi:MAG: CDP-glycerol glycerophosphotransferase family protein [Actinobacteria bacterium]|nr:CDP-glycerol glycerophosphotransferase family protein [Actinomycetota bacterium]MBU1609187.1 CDP-glycerol glycerophosphotransferase family protein [Actinomycetota bacterium]MBU2316790.1 CDP-glycerol glycerophosphotransferase family protein [Actinomycetota bacterium]MBU2386100.1 CDP-glycerol glycerophosphotransferase family protein [Actinomycetota bacterium]
MGIWGQVKAARRIARNLLRSRRNRALLADRLEGVTPPDPGSIEIAVYFADTRVNLYQIRQWYAPLAELAREHPVAIISRSPGTMMTLLDESPVPAVYLRRVTDLERFVAEQPLRLVFYVNQNTKNFQMFRYGRMWHVFVNHGESDKMYMTTNQYKAYDYAFVAGQAAKDRLARKLWNYDLDRRVLEIGRPQADHFAGELPFTPDDRTVVLYAPTWEGDRPAAAYGSIASHGERLVDALLATGRHRVIYRPHPRSGVVDRGYRAAHQRIVAALAQANAADPAAHHLYDSGSSLGWQLVAADVAITDISAMIYDRLATGKPLIVARPASADAEIDESGYLSACEWLSAEQADQIVPLVDHVLTSTEAHDALTAWVTRYFGDTTPGAATARFHAAVETLFDEWERAAAAHASDPITSESDPLDDEEDEDAVPGED